MTPVLVLKLLMCTPSAIANLFRLLVLNTQSHPLVQAKPTHADIIKRACEDCTYDKAQSNAQATQNKLQDSEQK